MRSEEEEEEEEKKEEEEERGEKEHRLGSPGPGWGRRRMIT